MKEGSNTTIKLERAKINEKLATDGEYSEDDVTIKNGKEILLIIIWQK